MSYAAAAAAAPDPRPRSSVRYSLWFDNDQGVCSVKPPGRGSGEKHTGCVLFLLPSYTRLESEF